MKFSPKLDEGEITRFVDVENKIKGKYPKIICSDGSVVPGERFSLILIRSKK